MDKKPKDLSNYLKNNNYYFRLKAVMAGNFLFRRGLIYVNFNFNL